MECCHMKGFLSYLILWCLRKKEMNGAELSKELTKRKGTVLSPGTIYPALKSLKEKKLIRAGKGKRYSLSEKGEKELNSACGTFCSIFYDMHEMAKRHGRAKN